MKLNTKVYLFVDNGDEQILRDTGKIIGINKEKNYYEVKLNNFNCISYYSITKRNNRHFDINNSFFFITDSINK